MDIGELLLNGKERIVIIDFEATCGPGISDDDKEIIEFSGVVVNQQLHVLSKFDWFVKPIIHPRLTPYCIKLTGITQAMIDHARMFPVVLKEFLRLINPLETVFASWGEYDKFQLMHDCELHELPYPFEYENHVDLKKVVSERMGFKKPQGIGATLRYLGLKFKGRPHRGIDDAKNIVRILRSM